MTEMLLKKIGSVSNGILKRPAAGWKNIVSRLEINPELEPALYGIEQFSHIQVFFWFDKLQPAANLLARVHPRGNASLPLMGRLATHSPHRPNPIGLSIVELIERKSNILTVRGLDALDGTPLIDIKPFTPNKELNAKARAPEWMIKK